MGAPTAFEELVTDGAAAPTDGWDFSWLDGRATEERPSWGYANMLVEHIGQSPAALDIQTGGGEVFAEVLSRVARLPPRLAATDSWPPNLQIAARNLSPFGASVVAGADEGPLPFADEAFDLVVSRHPVVTPWDEVARVLVPGVLTCPSRWAPVRTMSSSTS